MYEYVGAIHIHSTYSDGTGEIPDIARAASEVGLDFIMLSDHNSLKAKKDGWEGWRDDVMVLIGYEINDRDDRNHYLACGLDGRLGERIVREEMAEFLRWHKSLQVAPTIQDFRTTLEAIRAEEVHKNINRFTPEDRELVEMLTKRIVNKILHQPLTTLKQGAENGNHGPDTLQRIKVLRELFGLTKNESHGD